MAFYRCGGGGIPASVKTDMNAVLNKKFGTSSDYPPADWAPTVNLMGPLPEKTIVSSPIADFSDGADDVPTKSLVVTIPPTLSGKSEVVCTGAHSGNFYNLANGRQLNLALPKGTKIYCKTESPSSYIKVYMRAKGASTSVVIFDMVASMGVRSYTLTDDIEYLTMTENNYNTLVNGGYKIMISLESDGDYTPYQTPTVYTASLGRTIYGGSVDVVKGEGTDENGNDFTFTGQEIPTRLGYNAFWSDSGDTEVTYRADINLALGGQ